MKKVVLAYSGGLDSSVILHWLKATYHCEVIAYCADVGQGRGELEGVKEKAMASGALKCVVADLRKGLVEGYLWPLLKSGAVYENGYLLGTSIARPIVAAEQVRIAHEEGADGLAHGSTGKGNDQVRFELTYLSLDPTLKIIAPWREPGFPIGSREDAVDYAQEHGIPLRQTKEDIYSRDRNIWHISHEGADLEEPDNVPQESLFTMSRPLSQTPDKAELIDIEFVKGVPLKIYGEKVPAVKMMEVLNQLGGAHGIGQVDLVENRVVGMKSRGVYETPGGTILSRAHKALETLCLDRETMHYKQQCALRFAELVYDGRWFTPLREALQAFFDVTQENVTGCVKMKLYKGHCILAGMTSPNSLYAADLASFTMGENYDITDGTGFIRLYGLPLKVQALLKGKAKEACFV